MNILNLSGNSVVINGVAIESLIMPVNSSYADKVVIEYTNELKQLSQRNLITRESVVVLPSDSVCAVLLIKVWDSIFDWSPTIRWSISINQEMKFLDSLSIDLNSI